MKAGVVTTILALIAFVLFIPRIRSFIGYRRARRGWGRLKVPYDFRDYRNRNKYNNDLPF